MRPLAVELAFDSISDHLLRQLWSRLWAMYVERATCSTEQGLGGRTLPMLRTLAPRGTGRWLRAVLKCPGFYSLFFLLSELDGAPHGVLGWTSPPPEWARRERAVVEARQLGSREVESVKVTHIIVDISLADPYDDDDEDEDA